MENIMAWFMVNKVAIIGILAAVYGLLTAIVKFCPTIPAKYPWLITILKILGKITNSQTDHSAVRATRAQQR